MNKAILIVICDFLVSAMLTMMTGMVPGHSGGTGVGLDEKTTRVLLFELNRRQLELEAMRLKLHETIARSGTTPEKQAELQKITEELIRNIAKQEKLEGKLIAKAADSVDMDSLRTQLTSEELRRKELESELARLKSDLTGNLQKLADVSGDLRDKRRDNAVLTRQLSEARDAAGRTGKALDDTRKALDDAREELLEERSQLEKTKSELSLAESERNAARKDVEKREAELSLVRRKLDGVQEKLLEETRAHGATREQLAASKSESDIKSRALDAAKKELASEKSAHTSTREQLAVSKNESAAKARALDTAEKKLASEKSAHDTTRQQLAVSRHDAEAKDKELASTRQERDSERSANIEARSQIARQDTVNRTLQQNIRSLKGSLTDAQKEAAKEREGKNILTVKLAENQAYLESEQQNNAALKDENRRLQQALMVAKMEKQDSETQAGMYKNMHQDLVKAYTKQEAELKKAQSEKDQALLSAVKEVIARNQQQPQSAVPAAVRKDVYKLYAQAVLRVDAGVWEKSGIWGSDILGGSVTSFYPVVDFGKNRVLITGSFDRFAGDFEKVLNFRKVINVSMSWAFPYERNPEKNCTKLDKEMTVNSRYPHLAGFKMENLDKNIVPLKALSSRTLKERGIDNLLLFKSDAEGSHSSLDGRVSLITTENGIPALFIRNAVRNQLSAAPGDMVLTVQGEFAGIASRRVRINNVNGILVPLFNEPAADWDKTETVRLREVSKGNYSDYGMKIIELRKKYPRDHE